MPDIPVYSYEDLRKKADDFLRMHHSSGSIPVPIEEIVEFDFRINIVPVLGLQREFEVEGFTSGDLKNIYVDEYIYSDRLTRYRFTLAHEIGHVVLHRHLYHAHTFKSVHNWKDFINSMTEEEHSWLEYQGYAFAVLILVPKQNLIKSVSEWMDFETIPMSSLKSGEGGGPYCLDSLMGGISSEFIVKFFMKHQAASANG